MNRKNEPSGTHKIKDAAQALIVEHIFFSQYSLLL